MAQIRAGTCALNHSENTGWISSKSPENHDIEGVRSRDKPWAAISLSVDFFAEFLGAQNEVFDGRHGFLQIVHPSAVHRNSSVVIKQFEPKVERFGGRNLTEVNKSNFVCSEARQRYSLQSVFVFWRKLELYVSSTKSRFHRHFSNQVAVLPAR
jgi:hypothetical protein